jgi:hypothetical protein
LKAEDCVQMTMDERDEWGAVYTPEH